MGLMFMKFSRSDESQSDALGLKYMMAGGYDPRTLPNVFGMLEALSQQSGAGRLPQWMSTHPDPENRRVWATNAVAGLQRDLSGLAVNRPRTCGAWTASCSVRIRARGSSRRGRSATRTWHSG